MPADEEPVVIGNRLKPAHQDRSRRTTERLLAAARVVVADKGFEDASITDIVRLAKVSVGTFYTRLESKESLLHVLHEEATADSCRRIETELAPELWAGRTVAEIISTWVQGSFPITRDMAGFEKACYQRALTDPAFAEREAQVRRLLAARIRDLLTEHRAELSHPDPELAAAVLVQMFVGFLSDYANASTFPASNLPSDSVAAAELERACLAYLGVTPPT